MGQEWKLHKVFCHIFRDFGGFVGLHYNILAYQIEFFFVQPTNISGLYIVQFYSTLQAFV